MTKKNKSPPGQTSMFEAFERAEFERQTAYLPATIDEGVPYLLDLFRRLDDAVMASDVDAFERITQQAEDLAIRLNGGTNFGMCVDDGAAHQLERRTRATDGAIPLWGQQGDFVIDVRGMPVRIEFDGIYGVSFPGFAAHAVDYAKPFISNTGYRSFLGYSGHFGGGIGTGQYAHDVIATHIDDKKYGLKGKLETIGAEYVARHHAELAEEAEPAP